MSAPGALDSDSNQSLNSLIIQNLLTPTRIGKLLKYLPMREYIITKGLHCMQPSFTPEAQILWNAIPPHFQERILHNVWCPHCGDMTTMTDFTGEVHGRSLVLRGTCVTCRRKVARVLEGASENAVL